jgi:hypothetical protein
MTAALTSRTAQIRAVRELQTHKDYAFLSRRLVYRLTSPFGFVCEIHHIKTAGRLINGRNAPEVALEICKHLGITRNFGCLHECCDALLAHLGAAS